MGPARSLDDAPVTDTKELLSRLKRVGFAGVLMVSENGSPAIA